MGTYHATPEISGLEADNYRFTPQEMTFDVTALPVKLSWSESTDWRTGVKTTTAKVTNLFGEDVVELTYGGDPRSSDQKGKYTTTVTAVDDPNYTVIGGSNLTHNRSLAKSADKDAVAVSGVSLDVHELHLDLPLPVEEASPSNLASSTDTEPVTAQLTAVVKPAKAAQSCTMEKGTPPGVSLFGIFGHLFRTISYSNW